MNIYLQYFILGLVQGLTEFLPISSSGHLLLLEKLGLGSESLGENLIMHLATLVVVITVFRKELFYLIRHPKSKECIFILIASIPTAIMAALIRYFINDNGNFLPLMFLITSTLLFLPSIIKTNQNELTSQGLIRKAIITGIGQGIACFNGISRSGATISTMRLLGIESKESANLCFLLSIPIILGSSIVELITSGAKFSGNVLPLVLAMVTAFLVGFVAVKTFVKLLMKNRLWVFSIYTLIMAVVSFLLLFR